MLSEVRIGLFSQCDPADRKPAKIQFRKIRSSAAAEERQPPSASDIKFFAASCKIPHKAAFYLQRSYLKTEIRYEKTHFNGCGHAVGTPRGGAGTGFEIRRQLYSGLGPGRKGDHSRRILPLGHDQREGFEG